MPKETEDENAKKYRASTLGLTLAEALQSLVVEGQITKREAQTIMGRFDDTILAKVNEPTKPLPSGESESIEGDLDFFNCIDSLWHLRVKNARFEAGGAVQAPGATTSLCILATQKERKKRSNAAER